MKLFGLELKFNSYDIWHKGIFAPHVIATSGDYNDLKNKPTSLPSSGGNADTLGGKSASEFATSAQGVKADNALPSSSYTSNNVLSKLLTVDGSGSELDADLLDGQHGSYYASNSVFSTTNNGLVPKSTTATGKYLQDNGTWSTVVGGVTTVASRSGDVVLTSADVGLSNVNNTTDASKPVSTAQLSALNLKLDLAGGTITGPLVAPNLNASVIWSASPLLFVTTAGQTAAQKIQCGGLLASSSWADAALIPTNGIYSRGNIVSGGDITSTRVYNAVYNDYAEYFEKDENDTFEPGDLLVKIKGENKYKKSTKSYDKLIIGSYSEEYAQCIGGDGREKIEERFIPVGLAGRVHVKITGNIEEGDLITSSNIPGVGMKAMRYIPGTIIGKALESHEGESIRKIRMLISNF